MSRFFTLIVLSLITISTLYAQQKSTRYYSSNDNVWFMYFGNHKVSDKFGLHIEAQIRRNNWVQNWQQLLLRTGIDYYTSSVRLTVGYAFVNTFQYGEFPAPYSFPEHRIWQQALVSNPVGKVKLSHRYRLEQRWIGNPATGEFENGRYENRMRYMIRANIPLKGATIEPGSFYIGFYNEIFINFGREVAYNVFDQNRTYATLGFHLGKAGRVEVGYMYQLIQGRKIMLTTDPAKNVMEGNHTLQFSLASDLPFNNKK